MNMKSSGTLQCGPLVGSSHHLTRMLIVLIVVCCAPSLLAFSCGPCKVDECPDPGVCQGSLAEDTCGCCLQCARVENETCGGQFGLLGRCDEGLICYINPKLGNPITGHELGICKESYGSGEVVSCSSVTCDVVLDLKCPNDTMMVAIEPSENECCPSAPSCRCKPCPTAEPMCEEGNVPVLQSIGTGQPGTCCSDYECKDKAEFCANVTCEEVEILMLKCPFDSVSLPPIVYNNGCCSKHQGCKCGAHDLCHVPDCEEGMRLQVVSPATGVPGFCCDTVQCVNETAKTCLHQDMEYMDGETWGLDDCTTCTCSEGLVFCAAIKCENMPHNCGWMGIIEDQCCPICRGCIADNGETFENGAVWEKDPCVTCRCEDGEVYCQSEMCGVRCSHPRKVPGHCCPICDEITSVTLPPHCPLLENCTIRCPLGLLQDEQGCYSCQCKQDDCTLDCPLGRVIDEKGRELCECVEPERPKCPSMIRCQKNCVYGYKVNRHGCPRCRCNKCPAFFCKKKCQHGYQQNNKGCKLCKCNSAPEITSTVATPTTRPPSGRWCMSWDGRRMEDAESWFDGCRKCFCHEGREMCSLITCPVPKCHNPVIQQGDCCPSCRDGTGPLVPGLPTRCQASDGQYHAEGETWMLDECTQCICHDGAVLCEIESCPPVLCHLPIKLPSMCCTVCPELGLIPPVKKHKMCTTASGTRFTSGDSWRVNACQSCMCQDGQIHCFSQTCPLLTCNHTILKKGQCCPYCAAEERSVAKTCSSEGEEYSHRETWMVDDCTKCICDAGHTSCTHYTCSHSNCPNPIKRPGACCPMCSGTSTDVIGYPRGETPNSHTTPHSEVQDYPENESGINSHRITDSILITVVVLLSMCVIVLIILLLRTRRKDHQPPPSHPEPVLTAMDVKVRPKSTNVELQGVCPLPNTDSGKVAPWQPAEEQNAANKVVADELESKVPEIYNLILEGERTGKPLLDLQSLADVDPNSFRNSV